MARNKVVAAAVFIVGLAATFYIARGVAWRIQDFDKTQALNNPDCDDCVTTATLDALPYIALGLLLYVVIAGLVWWLLFTRVRKQGTHPSN